VNWLVIEGVPPWDGRYLFELEEQEPTTREWGWIKRHSGYLPLTIQQGLEGADPELFSVFAVIALRRAGRIENTDVQQVFDRFQDVGFGAAIRLEADEPSLEEGDAGPPTRSSGSSSSSNGDDSRTSSETSEADLNPSGIPGSATSESPPIRLAT